MDKEKFQLHLGHSVKLVVELTRQHCYNDIIEPFKFLIEPSGTDFHEGLDYFEKKNLTVLNQQKGKLLTNDEVIDFLFHNDKVPLWINTTIYECTRYFTVIHLNCSRRQRYEDQLFYESVPYPPFNILVPIPPDPLKHEINGKFDINWKKQLDDKQNPIAGLN